VTTVSAATAPASFAPDSYSQRQPSVIGNSFAQEFETHGLSRHDPGPSRKTSGTARQPKDDNGEGAPVSAPVLTPESQILTIGLYAGSRGTQADSESQGEAGAGPRPGAGTAPQTQGPELAAGDPQDTAFMMRMQTAAADDNSGLQLGLTDAGIPGIQKITEVDALAPLSSSGAQTQSALAAFEQGSQQEFAAEIKQVSAASQAPDLQALRADEQVRAPQPLNNIQLQLNQSSNEKVLVSLVQQAGELRLAVRTDDAALAHGLQQGLSDLVGKLQGNGYRADAWHPVQSPAAAGPTAESRQASNHSRQGDSQSQSGGSQGQGGRQQQNRPNRPRWVEEMESSLTPKGQATGESNGFSS